MPYILLENAPTDFSHTANHFPDIEEIYISNMQAGIVCGIQRYHEITYLRLNGQIEKYP